MKLAAWLSLLLILGAGSEAVRAQDPDQVPGSPAYRAFYGSFLPPTCCWTNGCCRRAKANEIEALDDTMTRYRVVASGQVIERSAWSPDGALHICQCDWDGGGWKTGPATNARCLAVPPPAG